MAKEFTVALAEISILADTSNTATASDVALDTTLDVACMPLRRSTDAVKDVSARVLAEEVVMRVADAVFDAVGDIVLATGLIRTTDAVLLAAADTVDVTSFTTLADAVDVMLAASVADVRRILIGVLTAEPTVTTVAAAASTDPSNPNEYAL